MRAVGSGRLDVAQQAEALEMLRGGMAQRAVGERFGVTKNVIAGLWARQGEPGYKAHEREPTTLFERCDAMHARLDAVLAATVGVGRIVEVRDGEQHEAARGA